MLDELLIVFVKNPVYGNVKTRLAKTVGNTKALKIYNALLSVTQQTVNNLSIGTRIYFSQSLEDQDWNTKGLYVQEGSDLGERMKNAFVDGFNDGYKKIILIGSDLPDISVDLIENAYQALSSANAVFGPAEDGGYYLIGLTQMQECIFIDKSWSQEILLTETLNELQARNIKVNLIETLNDIDTFEDLKQHPELLKIIEC